MKNANKRELKQITSNHSSELTLSILQSFINKAFTEIILKNHTHF